MKKLSISIFLLMFLSFSVGTAQKLNCLLYQQEIESIKNRFVKEDTLVVLNDFMYYEIDVLKELFIKDFNENKKCAVGISSFKEYDFSTDTVIYCNFNVDNVIVANDSFIEKYYYYDNTTSVPTNVVFTNVLFVDNEYAYFRIIVQNLNPGHFTRWVIFKRNDKEWHLIKSGYSIW